MNCEVLLARVNRVSDIFNLGQLKGLKSSGEVADLNLWEAILRILDDKVCGSEVASIGTSHFVNDIFLCASYFQKQNNLYLFVTRTKPTRVCLFQSQN